MAKVSDFAKRRELKEILREVENAEKELLDRIRQDNLTPDETEALQEGLKKLDHQVDKMKKEFGNLVAKKK
jgi:hypothetical protein